MQAYISIYGVVHNDVTQFLTIFDPFPTPNITLFITKALVLPS